MKQLNYIIPLMICMASTLLGCSAASLNIPCEDDPRCLIYGITSDILILDPHVSDSYDAGIIFRQLYDTLIYRDIQSDDFIPGLAESWQISDDGLVYTFSLRQNVLFHDGTQLTSQAVASNIDRIFDPEINSQRAKKSLDALSRYEIVDDFTIRFYLSEPYIAFMDGLAQPFMAIASPTALESYTNLRYQFHQIGTGPFKLDNYLPGDRIELSRNTVYGWLPAIYDPLIGGEINRIVFKIIPDQTQVTDALLTQEVDVIGDMLPSDASILSNNSSIQFLPIDIPGQSVQFYFNTQQIHTDNEVLRKSLLLAANRVAISDEVFLNYSPVAWSPLSQNTRFAHTGYINVFAYDSLTAADLLSSLGYEDTDGDGFREREGSKLELIMIVPPWGQMPEVAALLREQWRLIGVDLVIDPVPGLNSLLSRLASGEYHLVTIDNFGFDPSILNDTFKGGASANVTRYQNEALDNLLDQALQERDSLARRSQYLEIQSIIMDNTLILPIRDYVNINGSRSYVANLRFDAYGWYPLLFNVQLTQ